MEKLKKCLSERASPVENKLYHFSVHIGIVMVEEEPQPANEQITKDLKNFLIQGEEIDDARAAANNRERAHRSRSPSDVSS